jgi:CelD/BcsL family acetyltransferase involved in cellulose biosynthesis
VVVRAAAGEIVGGLPMVELGGRVTSRRWVALPFSDACPPLAGEGTSDGEVGNAVERLQRERGVSAVEVRGAIRGFETSGHARGLSHVLRLTDPDDLYAGFKSQVRRNIRKAEAAGVEVRRASQRSDLTRVYFDLHAATHRRLGVPSQPRRLFDRLWDNVMERGLGHVLLAYHQRVPIAGAVFLQWNGTIVYKYGASDQAYWPLRPNNLLFWECIRRACDEGVRTFDFGRTDADDEGLRSFKQGWGAGEEALVYTRFGRRMKTGSGAAARMLRPIVRAAPTWFGRSLGAALYRHAA